MAWDSYEELKPEILMGRKLLGAAVRRARLRHGLSQRQLGWYVALDQTTISRLETAKLKGMRFSTLCRVIGTISRADAFELPDAPIRSTRRLPGEAEANRRAFEHEAGVEEPGAFADRPAGDRSYDADGHGLEDRAYDAEIGSYEAAPPVAEPAA